MPKLLVRVLADFFALEVGKALDGAVAIHDQRGLGGDIGVGEVVLGLAGFGNRYLVGHRVVTVGIQAGNQAVPFAFDEFGFHTQLGGYGLGNFHIKTHQLAAGIVIGKRGISAFSAHADDTGGFDLGKVFSSGKAQQDGGEQGGNGKSFPNVLLAVFVFVIPPSGGLGGL